MLLKPVLGRIAAMGISLLMMSAVAQAEPAVPAAAKHVAVKHAAAKHAVKHVAARKTKAPAVSLTLVTKPANDAPDLDYRQRIKDAQDLLTAQPVQSGDMQLDANGNLTHFTWELAVGQRSGPLTVLRMDEKGNNDQGFAVTWTADNFINTHFTVKKPDGYIVFAQRRPVHGKSSAYEEGVYTAYAPELDTKTMRDAGMDYLQFLQRQAYDQIKNYDVRSQVAPDVTVADEIPQSMVLRLMITEHIDPLHMKFVGMEQCTHEVLFTLAANGAHSYAYAKSSAGALGLTQFVQSSYDMVRANYPQARLTPDFAAGMGDLHNAVMASVLLLDLELTEVPSAYLKQWKNSATQFSAFLAAGYNRNPVHVMQTYMRTHSFTGGHAPLENKLYVRIQDWIGGFLKKEYGLA